MADSLEQFQTRVSMNMTETVTLFRTTSEVAGKPSPLDFSGEAMKALARRFDAAPAFENGETVGVIDLDPPAAGGF
jgi:hypothetical protein